MASTVCLVIDLEEFACFLEGRAHGRGKDIE
jgi:hypothetical protein